MDIHLIELCDLHIYSFILGFQLQFYAFILPPSSNGN